MNFIPKPYKKEIVTIRLDTDTIRKVDALSAEYKMSRSHFIARCVEFALENMNREATDAN